MISFLLLAMIAATGCDSIASQSPVGAPVKLDAKDSPSAQTLDTLYSRLWVVEDEKGIAVCQFAGIQNDKCTLRLTRHSNEPDSKDVRDEKEKDKNVQEFQCLVRSWNERLILNVMAAENGEPRSDAYGWLLLLWIEEDPDGREMLCMSIPREEAFDQPRKTADGKEVKLDLVKKKNEASKVTKVTMTEEGKSGPGAQTDLNPNADAFRGTSYLITSDEATIRAYLSACKPEDLYFIDPENQKNRIAKAAKANMNYPGRPEFRKRVDPVEGKEAATQPRR